jgi:hypothetical protein
MELKVFLAIIAASLAVVGNVPYVRDILRGRVEPHAYTWLVWTLVTGITLFGQLAKGAGVGAMPAAVSLIFTFSIFLFSLKYGLKYITRIDTLFLLLALLGVVSWVVTKDPTLSVIIAVGVDLIAFIPTLRKTWRYPRTEVSLLYMMNVARHILALFALEAYNIATTLHSIAMIVMNTAMTLIILMRSKQDNGK